MLFVELCKPLNQRDLSLLSKTTRGWVLTDNYKKKLSEMQLTGLKKPDQRLLLDKTVSMQTNDSKSTKDTGAVAKESIENKQNQRFAQLRLDQYIARGLK
jgi:hypothetical protein